jgi:hypothetical protein
MWGASVRGYWRKRAVCNGLFLAMAAVGGVGGCSLLEGPEATANMPEPERVSLPISADTSLFHNWWPHSSN